MAAGGAAVRAFVAIDLPAPIKEALGQLQAGLDLPPEIIRWVRPENLHLTLQFLGEVPEAKVAAVGTAVEEVAHRADPFVVDLARLGAFPTLGAPRVVWVGVERGAEEAEALARALGRALRPLGFKPEDRAFRPHL
ncbi:MAG: RNA 2',3'-cyclic phosphodiesterase, partial [Deltaproteobacteria bacterium]|nr:RNA 2',3'-cyclic phosphodiesterase [Deltaproteobacteria bacterium]